MWLPDTHVWIAFLNKRVKSVAVGFGARSPYEIFLCDIVLTELYYGAYKSAQREANLGLLDTLADYFPSLPFDRACAKHCGEIRADLARQGKPIGPYDVQIAAVGLAHRLTVVTHNTREFARVKGLVLEDWEA